MGFGELVEKKYSKRSVFKYLLGHEGRAFSCIYTIQKEKRICRARGFFQEFCELVRCNPIADAVWPIQNKTRWRENGISFT